MYVCICICLYLFLTIFYFFIISDTYHDMMGVDVAHNGFYQLFLMAKTFLFIYLLTS
jgi:hypothetical protein